MVPAKTTSSILPPRSDLAPCSPITQDRASTMLDLPEPFGPTTQVMPGSRRSEVAEANDLKPRRVRLFRYTRPLLLRTRGCNTGPGTLPSRGAGTGNCGLDVRRRRDRADRGAADPGAGTAKKPQARIGHSASILRFDARVTNDI